jgi:hypothetical protein
MTTKAQLIESGERLTRTIGDVTMYAERQDGHLIYCAEIYGYPITGEPITAWKLDYYTIAYHRSHEMMPAYFIREFSTLDALIAVMREDDLRRWRVVVFD